MTWSRTWRRSMGWGSGFESSRSPLPNDPPRFPHLFWKVRENANENTAESRMKSELFASCLGEKNIFGMETQKPADTARCLPIFLSSLFTLYYSLFPTLLWASSAHPLVSPGGPLVLRAFIYPPPGLRCRVGRFAVERHWRSLTPSHAPTSPEGDNLPAWEGDGFI